jgi:hypothetical protein
MNDTDLDQADEEILTHTVSNEVLKAAAGTERGVEAGRRGGSVYTIVSTYIPHYCC